MLEPDEADLDVSRETLAKLRIYVDLLRKWNPKINLVSRRSLDDVWARHVEDSVQLARQASWPGRWVDLGSGGGLPGIVVAIIRQTEFPGESVALVESDHKKCAFLRTVVRTLDLHVTVHAGRIEEQPCLMANILSARALSDLDTLIGYSSQHLAPGGTSLFPKGRSWEKDVHDAQSRWNFELEVIQSSTDNQAAILKLTEIQRKVENDPQAS